MNIYGRKVVLRAVEVEDLPKLKGWANDPEIQHLLGGWHFPTSMSDQEKWLESLSCNSLHQRFAIDVVDHGLIGTANLINIDWKNRNAFHGVMLGDKNIRGRGYGVDAIMAIMRYSFDELGLERLDGDLIEYNKSSYNVYTKCGWAEEGRKESWFYRGGRFWDKIIVGITRKKYYEFVNETGYWSA